MGQWILPNGVSLVSGTLTDKTIRVKFDDTSSNKSVQVKYQESDSEYGTATISVTGCSGPTPPPVGDCETGRWNASYLTEANLNAVYSTASQCCDDSLDKEWRASGSITVKIINNSNYYIPFNGEIKYKGTTEAKHYFRVETSSGHFRYGGVIGSQGHDTNFFVPPHTTATLNNCQGSSLENGPYHFYISVLCSTDVNADSKHIEGYVLHNEDISFSNECSSSINGNTITFTIPSDIDGTRWRGNNINPYGEQVGNFHYALTLDEIRNTHGNCFGYKNGTIEKARVIPVYLNSGADWSAIETALTTKNSNHYYPYTIE